VIPLHVWLLVAAVAGWSNHCIRAAIGIWWKTFGGILGKLTKLPLSLLISLEIKGRKNRQWNIYGLISIVWKTSS